MFRNFLKIAFRNLWKNRTFSAINIIGLGIGLACFLLIAIYVLDELSFDKSYPNSGRIYRINADIRFGGNELKLPMTSDMMGSTLRKDYPEVEEYTRIYTNEGSKLIKKGNEFITEFFVAYVDSTFFNVFQVSSISGDLQHALYEPNTVVLTETAARKYFGTTDVVGKTIETNDNGSTIYKIMAVIPPLPGNSHIKLDFFFSMKNAGYEWGQFLSHNFHTYVLLKKGTDYKAFEKKLDQYITRYVVPQAREYMHINSMDDFRKAGNKLEYSLMPLTDIHLHSAQSFEITPTGNLQYVYIFSAVAAFILLIACINFMNLTTARSANRAREVGIRKVLGTEKKNLIAQFVSESTLMALLSLVFAIVITYLSIPLFNDVAAKSMSAAILFSPLILPLLLILPFVVGLLAGSYPAFYLSSFRPIAVLKGKLSSGSRASGFRGVLVVVQFFFSIIFIVGTIVVYRQLHFIQTRNLGFNKDQVLVINDVYALGDKAKVFKQDVLQMQGVQSGTLSGFLPVTNSSRNDNSFSKEAVMDSKTGFNMQSWTVDYDYIKTMGMQIIRGRDFSREFGSDSSAVIINEATAKFLGYSDPIGQRIYRSSGNGGDPIPYTIVGVVKDFNYESIRKNISALGFFLGQHRGLASFKVKAADVPALLGNIEKKWKSMAAGLPFSYRFLDDSFDEMYRSEQRLGKIALSFSVLAILIACLGLFGLATYIAEQRTKEIGIRKVLGASVSGIVRLLSKDFVVLVIVAFVIATPLSWWAMNKWLQDFVYRIDMSWWIFLAAGGIALLIALLTVSVQAIRAALANPATNLRNE